ncbi:MAG: hypothetical protein WAM14_17990 [Candidatus Nitrosopolaris sp.]
MTKQCDKCGSTDDKGQWYFAFQEKRQYTMCKRCFFIYLDVKDQAGHGTPFDWDKAEKAGQRFLKNDQVR